MDSYENFLRAKYQSLYWEKQSECLAIENKIYSKNNQHFLIKKYSGTYLRNDNTLKCEIRRVEPRSGQNIYNIAKHELRIIYSVSDSRRFCEFLGFYFEGSPLSYYLVSKSYSMRLYDIIDSAEQVYKEKILHETIQGIAELHEKGLFHGGIDPSSIYIDRTDESVKIGDFFFSGYCNEFKNYFKVWELFSTLLNEEFVAPEVRLLQQCTMGKVSIQPFDPQKCDTFSIGLLILWVFKKLQGICNLLEIDVIKCNKNFVIMSAIDTYRSKEFRDLIFTSKLEQEINKTELTIKKLIDDFAMGDKNKTYSLAGALNVFYSDRIDIKKLLGLFENEEDISQVESEENHFLNCFEGNTINFECFEEIMLDFSGIINGICRLSLNSEQIIKESPLTLEEVNSQINALLNRLSSLFRIAFDSFYDTPVREEIKVVDGIITFIYSILYQLSDQETLKSFKVSTNLSSPIDYKSAMYIIMKQKTDFRHYLVNGLCSLNFMKDDWSYFFVNSLESGQDIRRLTDYPIVIEKFIKVLCSDIMKKIFKDNFNKTDLRSWLENRVFPNTFILKTQPSVHGMTSYDLVIYINGKVLALNDSISWQGAVLVTFIHELAHFVTRENFLTRKQVRDNTTPEHLGFELNYRENLLPVPDKLYRGEAGFRLECLVFGNQVKEITAKASEVLLKLNEYGYNIKKFRNDFRAGNKIGHEFIPLSKEANDFSGVKCSFMN